jgi:hypothetical protein
VDVLSYIWRVVRRNERNKGYLCLSESINQAQSRTKLRNFGWAATRIKTRKTADIGVHIHRDLFWAINSHKNWTSLYPVQTYSELDHYMSP